MSQQQGDAVKGLRKHTSHNTPLNAMSFVVEQMLMRVNTALPVRVDKVEPSDPRTGAAGYVNCTPLVCQLDADGNILEPQSIPKLPFFRLQASTAAVIIDPRPGDVGLAVFAQSDSSQVPQGESGPDPVRPGTFRKHDKSDGFYVGGFLGQSVETWIELDPDAKTITINGPEMVTVNTKVAVVNASESYTVNTTVAEINASERISLNTPYLTAGQDGGQAVFMMDIEQTGSHHSTGDQVAGDISLMHHTHPRGGGNTGEPNSGTEGEDEGGIEEESEDEEPETGENADGQDADA